MLLDVFMPVMHGYEICKKLKEDPDLKDIPVILFSAAKELPKAVKEVGAVDYVAKPFNTEELVDKIRFYINK